MALKTTATDTLVAGQRTVKSGSVPSSYASFGSTVFASTKDSTSTPYWRDKVAKSQSASNPYSCSKYFNLKSAKVSIVSRKRLGNSFLQYSDGYGLTIPTNVTPVLPDYTNANEVALKNIKASISKDVENFKSLVPLAELGETRKMLRQITGKSLTLVKDLLLLKRQMKNKRYWSSIAHQAADRWLEFSFGVKPLISDANSALQAIDDILNPEKPKLKAYVGFDTTSNTSRGALANIYNTGHVIGYARSTCTSNVTIYYNAGVLPKLGYDNDYGVDDHFGLNFGEIVGVAWELIPYSWLVDYFTTCGDFFTEVFTTRPYRCIYVTKTIKSEYNYTCNPEMGSVPSGVEVLSFKAEAGTLKKVILNRTVMNELPIPSLRIKTVDEIGRNSVNRLLNLASLLVIKNTHT